MLIYSVLSFVLGLIVGSFANVLVLRTQKGESIVSPGSHCPNCHEPLKWQDNIPVFSYLLLKGKCRYCHKLISWQYPVVEAAVAMLFVSLYAYFTPGDVFGWLVLILWWIATVLLVAAFVYDLRWYELPDQFTLPVIGIAVLLLIFAASQNGLQSIVPQLIATVIYTGIYFALYILSKEKFLGGGDIRLAVLMGLLLSVSQLLVGVFVAYLSGALAGLLFIALGRKNRTDRIPFAPFLIFGLYFGLFFGSQISAWYLSFF